MQYEAIRDERRMAANTATRIGDAFLSLLSFGQSFLDVFLRKDVDDTAKGRITFNNGAVNKGIVVFSEDGTFADGLTGHGARICPDGSAELDSLTLRRFLEVPELRFNRVSVQVGNQWRAPGGGIIRSVSPAADATGTALLHLEAGEIGTVAVGDVCMGIYHSETAADNAEANSDDNHGNFRFAGFYTAYWEITAVADYTDGETGQTFHNGKVSYRLRPVSANYPRQMHPTAAMHFVCYGNRTDTARQSSRYSTLTYERFLTGVSDWEFSSKQIRMQVGDLSAFSPVPGMDFSGYSVYANSIYLDGHLKQLAEMGAPTPTPTRWTTSPTRSPSTPRDGPNSPWSPRSPTVPSRGCSIRPYRSDVVRRCSPVWRMRPSHPPRVSTVFSVCPSAARPTSTTPPSTSTASTMPHAPRPTSR